MSGSSDPETEPPSGRWSPHDEPTLMAAALDAYTTAQARGLDNEHAIHAAADAIVDGVPSFIQGRADASEGRLRRDKPKMLAHYRWMRCWFESRLDAIWGDALDELQALLVCCQELGSEFNAAHQPSTPAGRTLRVEALVSVHARACLVASEMHALLRTGHALGADARWRTLHELAVVAEILEKGDEDLAERFLIHGQVEAYMDAVEHEKHREQTGRDPIDPVELSKLQEVHDAANRQYGPKFKYPWRWADPVTDPKTANFYELEKIAGLGHRRPDFSQSSNLVHGGSSGAESVHMMFRGDHVLRTGPSNHGLASPGHGAAISLVQVTMTLLMSDESSQLDPLKVSKLQVLQAFTDSCGDAFGRAAQELDRVEEAFVRGQGRGRLGTLLNNRRLDAYWARRRWAQLRRLVGAHLGRR